MLRSLLAEPGVEEILDLRSPVGFLALHGGNQDRLTEVIAGRAAERSGASLYAIVQPPDLRWHLPSYAHDPFDSRRLAAFLDHVEVVFSIHGYGRDGWRFDWVPRRPHEERDTILLGGSNRALARTLGASLRAALPQYPVIDDLGAIPRGARGVHARNPVNLPPRGGVQVEIPPGPRGLRDGPTPDTDTLIGVLAKVARVESA